MRLIDADALAKKLDALAKHYSEQGKTEVVKDYIWACAVVDNAPTVDAAPVVHSSWEISIGGNGWNEWSICKCKNCGREYKNFDNENYCPNCGAKMDGDEK